MATVVASRLAQKFVNHSDVIAQNFRRTSSTARKYKHNTTTRIVGIVELWPNCEFVCVCVCRRHALRNQRALQRLCGRSSVQRPPVNVSRCSGGLCVCERYMVYVVSVYICFVYEFSGKSSFLSLALGSAEALEKIGAYHRGLEHNSDAPANPSYKRKRRENTKALENTRHGTRDWRIRVASFLLNVRSVKVTAAAECRAVQSVPCTPHRKRTEMRNFGFRIQCSVCADLQCSRRFAMGMLVVYPMLLLLLLRLKNRNRQHGRLRSLGTRGAFV